jgi:hypothetical protein
MHEVGVEPAPERAIISPVHRDKHRLPGWQLGTSHEVIYQDDKQELQGLGTEEWAAQAAPFLCLSFLAENPSHPRK